MAKKLDPSALGTGAASKAARAMKERNEKQRKYIDELFPQKKKKPKK